MSFLRGCIWLWHTRTSKLRFGKLHQWNFALHVSSRQYPGFAPTLPQTSPSWEGTPLSKPHPLSAFGASILTSHSTWPAPFEILNTPLGADPGCTYPMTLLVIRSRYIPNAIKICPNLSALEGKKLKKHTQMLLQKLPVINQLICSSFVFIINAGKIDKFHHFYNLP